MCFTLSVSQTAQTAASSWQGNVYASFLQNVSSALGSHGECNTEVFSHRVGVQLEGWEASEETKLLAGCRPCIECSSYNQTRCNSPLFNLVSVSPDSCCSSSARPFKKWSPWRAFISYEETKHPDLFGNISPDSRQPLNTQYEIYCLTAIHKSFSVCLCLQMWFFVFSVQLSGCVNRKAVQSSGRLKSPHQHPSMKHHWSASQRAVRNTHRSRWLFVPLPPADTYTYTNYTAATLLRPSDFLHRVFISVLYNT